MISTATQFAITGLPVTVTAGQQVPITVRAVDPLGVTDTSFSDTIQFTSTDSRAVAVNAGIEVPLPPSATLINGQATFDILFKTAGSQKLTVTDVARATVKGTATVSITAAQAHDFRVTGFPSPAQRNLASTFTVTAVDAFGNRATEGNEGTKTAGRRESGLSRQRQDSSRHPPGNGSQGTKTSGHVYDEE